MKKEPELKLQEEFPFMRNNNPYAPYMFENTGDWIGARKKAEESGEVDMRNYNLYEQFGCCCNDGWYEVLYGLCRDITAAYEKRGLEPDVVPQQIKEKFGTLRFYYSLRSTGESSLTLDFLGTGDSLVFSPNQSEIGKEVRDIVNKWQKKSAQVCEFCGAEGQLRKLLWVKTLCDKCYGPAKVRDDERRAHYEKVWEKREAEEEGDKEKWV
jgi:hypothetical protein